MNRHDRAWATYSERFRSSVLPKIMASGISLTVYSGDGSDFDVQQATELGAMLLLDKPLILIVLPGATAPSRLRAAADAVVDGYVPGVAEHDERLAVALRQVAPSDESAR